MRQTIIILILLLCPILAFDGAGSSGLVNPSSAAVSAEDLAASTFFGGIGKDGQYEVPMVFAADGSIYVAGRTKSADLPKTAGAYREDYVGGVSDIFIARFSADLTSLLAVTYLGGTGEDGGWPGVDLALDDQGNVYVTGKTSSTDFPTTETAWRRTLSGTTDVFVSVLDGNLQNLLSSTYLGGAGQEYYAKVRVNQSGQVVVCGTTSSNDFPTPGTVWDNSYNGGGGGPYPGDVFLAVMDADLTTVISGTYIGGLSNDYCEAIEFDSQGDICIAGWTSSTTYPTVTGAYRESWNGGSYDAFVTVVAGDLSSLTASTFLGGSQWDFAYGMAVADDGAIYVTGHTASTDFPTLPGAFDRNYGGTGVQGTDDDCFVSRLSADLSDLTASTFLGHLSWEIGTDVAVDAEGRVYVAGNTRSMYFPFTFDSYDPDYNGSDDVFLTVLDPDLTWPVSATFLGGSAHEILGCILIDPDNNVYLSGSTNSSDFPTITGSYDPDFNGAGGVWDGEDIGGDVYVTIMPRTFYVDSDDDSRMDAGDNCPQVPNWDQSDADFDGAGDVCDECTDTDGDGYGDPGFPANTCLPDNCPGEYNADQADADQDGVGTLCDNCPGVYNPDQLDSDHDDVGDACETCCVGRTGDANGEGGDEPTIGDISTLIDALFISGNVDPLPCLTEADINQSGGSSPVFDDITIGDISHLIDYLFITGSSLGLPDCL